MYNIDAPKHLQPVGETEFARGAVRAAMWAFDKKPGLYAMTDVLGLE